MRIKSNTKISKRGIRDESRGKKSYWIGVLKGQVLTFE